MDIELSENQNFVWELGVLAGVGITLGFRMDLHETDLDAALKIGHNYILGKLTEDQLPTRLWLRPEDAEDSEKKLPHMFLAGFCVVVSQDVMDILEKFDFGSNIYRPVELYKHDRLTPYDGTWYVLHFSHSKSGFELEKSSGLRKPRYGYPASLGTLTQALEEDKFEVVMNKSVLNGPDVWLDDGLPTSLFISDALMQALRAADLIGKTQTVKCVVR